MTLASHLRRWAIAYLAILIAATLFKMNFVFGINSSASLPHRLFLIHKGKQPARGQYLAFRWNGTTYRSLTAAASAIAGSKWNGPRFFGLREGVKVDGQA